MKHLYWLLAGVLAFTSASATEVRIAFVNTNTVLEQAPQAEAARTLLQKEFSSRDTQLVAEQKKLREQEEKLAREGVNLRDDERRRLERDVVAQQRDLKRARDEFTEDLNIRRNEEFARLQREVAKVIVEVAKESGYDLVLESGVVYASDRVDITSRVLDRLRKNLTSSASNK
jgi:outer membrane protein